MVFSQLAIAEKVDYSQLKPEYFENLKNNEEFLNKDGDTLKIENTKSFRGLESKGSNLDFRHQRSRFIVYYSLSELLCLGRCE